MLAWDHLRFALALARHGTVARAGAALGMEAAAAAERFRAMEEAAGATLFLRTRTGLQPTDAGWRLLRAAERLAEEMSRVKRAIPPPSAERVRIRVAIDAELAAAWLRASGDTLLSQLAGIELELRQGADAELTVGWGRPEPERWTARRLGALGVGLYASSAYLGDRGRPRSADTLAGHTWVVGAGEESPADRWVARHARGGTVVLRADDPALRAAAVEAGLGVGAFLQGSEDAYPELVRLFPIPGLRPRTLWLGLPRDTHRSRPLRRAVKALDAAVGETVRRWQKRG
jgi:DNA-binding transcriptional LysR family regulator